MGWLYEHPPAGRQLWWQPATGGSADREKEVACGNGGGGGVYVVDEGGNDLISKARETRTLRELTAPDLIAQPICITFPALDYGVTFELKSGENLHVGGGGVSAMGSNSNSEDKVDSLSSLVQDFMGRKLAIVCGIFSREGHPSDLCPQIQEGGCKFHPNFCWANSQTPPQATPNSTMSTEDMILALTSVTQDRAENKQNFKNLENQVSQLATFVGHLEAKQSVALPSQTVLNPRENVSVVSLRNSRKMVKFKSQMLSLRW
ncbi:hypothetical protein KSS87_014523 [Heliosperma pusillum]|nr:hypothetical protein KSS87_014523 [Heliosperma pusillum]